MLHPSKTGVKRELSRRARPSGAFDARRYFRGAGGLRFYNVGTAAVREIARTLCRSHPDWSIDDAAKLADALMRDRYLETKGVGIELVARYGRQFTPRFLSMWKRWLSRNDADNWATTDAICGSLIGPLIFVHPRLVPEVAAWAGHRNMWVRRASAVSLIPTVRTGRSLDAAYTVARRLHADREDLIQKAVGWMLREAGKTDADRLERYLRAHCAKIPRITFRYAIERFDETTRRSLLSAC
jgi:3-methyladenine DNA glycosylase AlkD